MLADIAGSGNALPEEALRGERKYFKVDDEIFLK